MSAIILTIFVVLLVLVAFTVGGKIGMDAAMEATMTPLDSSTLVMFVMADNVPLWVRRHALSVVKRRARLEREARAHHEPGPEPSAEEALFAHYHARRSRRQSTQN
jgi:hypothetical protein